MIEELNKKLLININDIGASLSISKESAKVTASRYVKKGALIRIKNDLYITPDKYRNLKEEEMFKIANYIQIPSYISLVSALSFYNITTQQHRNFIESVSLKRTKDVTVREISFIYSKIKKIMYEGFEFRQSRENIFIALPDKALSDIVYLASLGRYSCDFDAIDFKKINKNYVRKYLDKSNKRAKLFWEKLCRIYKI